MTKPAEKGQLRRAGQEVRVSLYLDYREFLQAIYQWLKKEMGSYSYLQFAEDLGFSATNILHLIIRGKRRLSVKGAARVSDALCLRTVEKQYLDTLVRHVNARLPSDRAAYFEKLTAIKNRALTNTMAQSQLAYYSEWYHPVIREMVGMKGFVSDPNWIASRIQPRVLPEQVRRSLELLTSIDLIRFDESLGRHVLTSPNLSTGDEVLSMAVVRYHQKVLEIARDAITGIHSDRRDVSAVTVCVTDATAERMRVEISEFRRRLLAMADGNAEEADQIFQVNIQLFPFTK